MKVAVAGKGGVGKTTVAGTLSRLLAREGYRVLAVDADPAMNLAYTLGLPAEAAAKIVPLSENSELIRERTAFDASTGVYKLNPKVSDLAEKFGVPAPDGVQLLVMGTVKLGGTGCMCPANALLRALLRNLLLERGEAVVMDMEAGLEHLGRGTVRGVEALLVVVEPGGQAVETAKRIEHLAQDLGIPKLYGVGNKLRSKEEEDFIRQTLSACGIPLLEMIPYDLKLAEADRVGKAPLDYSPSCPAVEAIKNLEESLKKLNP
ncbi:AAA family ATPase [Candidatus Hecatella orcuttiae]|jgi:CO dehydrogenase maturation factor|uniref:ATP-binding protein n=1 Tax=Candidatus Hecatella orcuttiae TaxID=1935119 RepID=UPI002867D7E5|nr:AAA family ATPase [Candidatus Hecatella orcuttiae]